MKFTRQFGRRISSLICLCAALLLQGPVVLSLALVSGVCCSGDHCAVAAHHHAAAKTGEAPMDCGHDVRHGGDRVQPCSMSCCDTSEQFAVHGSVFLLSPAIELATASRFPEIVSPFDASGSAAPFAPLSPPPKSGPSLI